MSSFPNEHWDNGNNSVRVNKEFVKIDSKPLLFVNEKNSNSPKKKGKFHCFSLKINGFHF